MAKGLDTQRTGKVQAAYTTVTATQQTTDEYVAVEFEFANRTDTELLLGHAVSLLIHAKATDAASLIKVLAKPNKDYPDWTTLVAETALAVDEDVEVYAGLLRYHVIQVQIKESDADGSVTVALCAK